MESRIPEKLMQRLASEKKLNERNALINDYMSQLAVATDQELSDQRVAVYCQALSDLSEPQLHHAFHEALKNLGLKLPAIRELRQWAQEVPNPDDMDEREITLARLKKTLDYWRSQASPEPKTEYLSPQELAAARSRYDVFVNVFNQVVTKGEENEWLEIGREKQREFIARCHQNPQWITMAQRLGGFPGLTQRLPPTAVPTDPEERKEWATEKAKEHGWQDHE